MTGGPDNRQDQPGETHAAQIQYDRGMQKQDLNPKDEGKQGAAQAESDRGRDKQEAERRVEGENRDSGGGPEN